MIRALLAILLIAGIALALAWTANQPGAISIDWFGWTVTSHPAWAVAVAVALLILPLLFARIWGWLRYRSGLFGPGRKLRRQASARGYSAGALAAYLTGQERHAAKLAARALRIDPDDWAASAVAALAGDASQDARLRADPATTLLAALAAYRRHPDRSTAETAAALAPASAFAWEAALDERARDGDYAGGRTALANWVALDPEIRTDAGWIGAALDFAAAQAAKAEGDRDRARAALESALKSQPGFAPAAAELAGLFADDDRLRAAEKVIETAWKAAPHPILAQAYAGLQPLETQGERLQRIQRLVNLRPDHPESRMTLATHALAAGEADQALLALGPLLEGEGVRMRAAQLAAQAHRRLGFDPPASATWLDALTTGAPEADWECRRCHAHSRDWHLACPSCGHIGRLAWSGERKDAEERPSAKL